MSRPGRRSIEILTLVFLAISPAIVWGLAWAIPPADAAGATAPPASRTIQYLPSISDLMIATIQPRHIRLWLAAQSNNWDFAAYELKNLQGAFKRLGQAHPVEQDIPFPEMITSATEQQFTELNTAIKSKNDVGFTKAYADLTSACNSCHQAMNHGGVVIRVPSWASVSDQDFTPATP